MTNENNLTLIKHGDLLTPASVNVPLLELQRQIAALSNVLNLTVAPSANIILDAPTSAAVGQAVYFNSDTGTFDPAVTSIVVELQHLKAEESSFVLGIVCEKTSANTGHILVNGVYEINVEDNHSYDNLQLGVLYLSNTVLGALVNSQPAVKIPVAYLLNTSEAGDGKVKLFVNPNLDPVLHHHKHYRFPMKNVPSGSTDAGSIDITNAGANIEGWLPVIDDNGINTCPGYEPSAIPAGAKFAYNIAQSAFKNWFPPAILNASRLYWRRPNNTFSARGEVPEELYILTNDGIFWMSDTVPPWDSSIAYTLGVPQSPPLFDQDMHLYYIQLDYGMNDLWVQSLDAEVGSGLVITEKFRNKPASTGRLKIGLDLTGRLGDTNAVGYKALKNIEDFTDSNGNLIKKALNFGSVVAGLRAIDKSFSITGDEVDCNGYVSGYLTITTNTAWEGARLPVEYIHLNGMVDNSINNVTGITFRPNIWSGFTGQIQIPSQIGIPVGLSLNFVLAAHQSMTLTNDLFVLKYKILNSASDTPNQIPADWQTLDTVDLSAEVNQNDYVQLKSENIPGIPFGAIVVFSLEKANTLTVPVTVLQQYGIVHVI